MNNFFYNCFCFCFCTNDCFLYGCFLDLSKSLLQTLTQSRLYLFCLLWISQYWINSPSNELLIIIILLIMIIIKIFQQNDLIKFDKNCSVSFFRVKKKMDSKGPYGNGFLGFDLFPIKRCARWIHSTLLLPKCYLYYTSNKSK